MEHFSSYANDTNMLGENKYHKEKHRNSKASREVDLEVNTREINYMVVSTRMQDRTTNPLER
jgi:hypothetical protein